MPRSTACRFDHITASMPLLWLSLAFLAGILLASLTALPETAWLILAGVCIVQALLLKVFPRFFSQLQHSMITLVPDQLQGGRLASGVRNLLRSLPLPASVVLASLCFGAARYQAVLPVIDPGHIAWYNDRAQEVLVEAVLSAPPVQREGYQQLWLNTARLQTALEEERVEVTGKLLAYDDSAAQWRYGDRLRLRGTLETPFESEEFSYRAYLRRQGVYSLMRVEQIQKLADGQGNWFLAWIFALRLRALQTVYRLWPDPEAALLAGVLLGEEAGIALPVEQAFQNTGTAHIIAISGFNMAIIAGLLAGTLGRWLGPRYRFQVAALITLLLALYALLVGASPSVLRAAVMAALALLAAAIGRRQDGLNTLAFVAALMALFNPLILWDVSFQLSFLATLGLVLYADPLLQGFTRLAGRYLPEQRLQRLSAPLGEYCLFTLAALVVTLPVMVTQFHRLSLVALVANPVILPVQPAMMVLGGAAVLLGMVSPPLGQLAGWLAWPFAAYTIRVVEWFNRFPSASITLSPHQRGFAWLGLAALLGATLAWAPLKRLWARIWGAGASQLVIFGLVGAAALTLLVWSLGISAPDGKLRLTLLDVGDGDALLIQTPDGRYVLVDGGSSLNRLSDSLGRRLPLFQRRLDWLVVAGAEKEQLEALPGLLEWIPAENVLWSGPPAGSTAARRLRESLSKSGTPVSEAQAGQALDLGSGARLEVAAVSPRGAVLRLVWGNFSALLPIGMDFETLEAQQQEASPVPVSALLLADGGYAPLNPPGWIERWQPQVVLLSVAAGDREGRPDSEVLEAVKDYTLLRTDRNGWIELTTDGEQMWVGVERE